MTCAQKEGLLSEAAAEEVGLCRPSVVKYLPKTSHDCVPCDRYKSMKKFQSWLAFEKPVKFVKSNREDGP